MRPRIAAFALALGLLAGAARAETLTVTLTTPSGTLTATRTVSDTDEAKLQTALSDTFAAANNGATPTPQQEIDLLVSRWVTATIQFVLQDQQNTATAGIAPIGIQ